MLSDLLLCFWMALFVYRFKFSVDHMGIQLRGGNITVSHQFLQGSEICAVFQQMDSETVAKCMGRNLFFNSGFVLIELQYFPESLAAHSKAIDIDK